MSTKLYVGNLSFSVNDGHLSSLFQQFGAVDSATVIMDRATSRSKGFGFVEMNQESDARQAINTLNGSPFEGRNLTVSEARPQEPRERRPSRDGFNGGSRGSRY